nr:hypothetical protein [Deinococcota bacterium]
AYLYFTVCSAACGTLRPQQQPKHPPKNNVKRPPGWKDHLTAEDLRAVSPLKGQHLNPYRMFTLDMSARLPLEAA